MNRWTRFEEEEEKEAEIGETKEGTHDEISLNIDPLFMNGRNFILVNGLFQERWEKRIRDFCELSRNRSKRVRMITTKIDDEGREETAVRQSEEQVPRG